MSSEGVEEGAIVGVEEGGVVMSEGRNVGVVMMEGVGTPVGSRKGVSAGLVTGGLVVSSEGVEEGATVGAEEGDAVM